MWISRIIRVSCLFLFATTISSCYGTVEYIKPLQKWPTVAITILVRNKANALPYFLSSLSKLDYPKERIIIWIHSDFNSDNSDDIIKDWVVTHSSEYHEVHVTTNATTAAMHADQETVAHWSKLRYKHVIKLREKALNFARKMWADYLFMLDADVLLTEPLTLKHLVNKEFPIAAPMLISDGVYSNFWCGMDDFYYYKRTEDYRPILRRYNIGCFDVPMVHSAVLINLKYKNSDLLTYVPEKVKNYEGPEDDIIVFAIGATKRKIPMHVCNDHIYGFVPVPLEKGSDVEDDYEEMLNVKMESLGHGYNVHVEKELEKYVYYPKPTKLNFTEIFMINLERRKERRELMEVSFKELGLNVTLFKAIDGKSLTKEDLQKYNITLLPNYEDPFHKRPMKAGEIGCFLSHYLIWQKIVENHYDVTLILEDDIHFVPFFKKKFYRMMNEIKRIDWDLVYIGRKILLDGVEPRVTDHTTRPLYSYWTLGYALRERGAKKLLAGDPLSKLLPVDEYIPIMFNQHPALFSGIRQVPRPKNESVDQFLLRAFRNTDCNQNGSPNVFGKCSRAEWVQYFPVRNVRALSASPLLVHPTHYTGEDGYISDTEDSNIVYTKPAPRTEL